MGAMMSDWQAWRWRLGRSVTPMSPSEAVIRRLHEITTQYRLGFPEQTRQLLRLGAERFGLEIGILAHVVGDKYRVVHAVAPPEVGLSDGATFAFGTTYCSITLQSEGPVGFEYAHETSLRTHPAYGAFGLEAYLGAPVIVAGEVFGTLNFSSARARPRRFEAVDVDCIQLMADWVGAELERHRAEASLAAANDELRSVAYTVTHDLRQPLSAIIGSAEFLLEDQSGRLDVPGVRDLEAIHRAASQMGDRINALLGMYQLTETQPDRQPMNLAGAAREIADRLVRTEPRRRVRFDIPRELVVSGDAGLLRSVLDNLMGNAWKFTRTAQSARITVGHTTHDGIACVFVNDNGVGFDQAEAQQIFEPFRQANGGSGSGGSGIGLATVRRIVRIHQGRVWAESAPGQGATFYFTLG